jgi:aspartate racemase
LSYLSMSKHIGIVACSAEGAALCYRTICTDAAQLLGPHRHPQISLHSHSLSDYVDCLEAGDLWGVAELMLSSANRLASCGAELLICPDNTIHQAMHLVTPRSPLPWLHIADVVAQEAASRGFHQLGLTGTRWLVDSDVYPAQLALHGIDHWRPPVADRDRMTDIIMGELVYGTICPTSVSWFQALIEQMADGGCDAVVLGCTEIPLIINDSNSRLPTLDSTRLLARASLAVAVADH